MTPTATASWISPRTWTYTAVHTVTQAEMDAGSDIVNIGTVDSTEARPRNRHRDGHDHSDPGLHHFQDRL